MTPTPGTVVNKRLTRLCRYHLARHTSISLPIVPFSLVHDRLQDPARDLREPLFLMSNCMRSAGVCLAASGRAEAEQRGSGHQREWAPRRERLSPVSSQSMIGRDLPPGRDSDARRRPCHASGARSAPTACAASRSRFLGTTGLIRFGLQMQHARQILVVSFLPKRRNPLVTISRKVRSLYLRLLGG